MWELLFILTLCPFSSCWSTLDASDCECSDVTLTPNSCYLEDESLSNLEQGTKVLNTSKKVLNSQLNQIKESLGDQMNAIDEMNSKLITRPLTKRQATSNDTGVNYGYKSCSHAYSEYGKRENAFYEISVLERAEENFSVWCTMTGPHGGGWTRILHRSDASVSFEKTWDDYKAGFGEDLNYFIGLDRLHSLTTDNPQTLLVTLEDSTKTRYAEYAFFAIGDENEKYNLKVLGNYQGDAGDSLSEQQGLKFSTPDQINEQFNDTVKCDDETFLGGWWYKKCFKSNLCGRYYNETEKVASGSGIVWETMIPKTSSLKSVEMSIRKGAHAGCFIFP